MYLKHLETLTILFIAHIDLVQISWKFKLAFNKYDDISHIIIVSKYLKY